jgi:hypothetical protein
MNPKYPIFIPSKGRWESRLTVRALENLGVPYKIVIEPQEYNNYAKVIDKRNILLLPWSKPNSNTKLVKARCWIKEYSISVGAERHWQLDDNIYQFYRLNNNLKVPVGSGTIFRVAEDFTDRFENIAISGFNYFMFASRKEKITPFYLNTRVYSCSLINNKIPHLWRGIYNDDTDICLRVLKDGWCTILFNAFLCEKATTMTIKGGNTNIYKKDKNFDGRLLMAQSLVEQHPDVARVSFKWGRYQHHVDYSKFRKNKLILKSGLEIPDRINNYGMKLINI